MKFKLKKYKDKEYIEYINDDGLVFNNAEYFMIDVHSEKFAEVMHNVGGFTANVTTRFIEENQLDASYIMFCCIPQKYNDFVFKFVYLDNNLNILKTMEDNNFYDYKHFVNKFESCISKKGFIYELENIKSLNTLTSQFCSNPSIAFNFTINGKEVHYEDTLICKDFSFFKENIRENLKKINAKYCLLSFNCSGFSGITLKGNVIDEDNEPIKYFQVESGIKDINEYVKVKQHEFSEYTQENVDDDDFDFNISLDIAKKIPDSFMFYEDNIIIKMNDSNVTNDYDER